MVYDPTSLSSSHSRANFHEGALVTPCFRTIVSRCCWTIVGRQIMGNHGSIARSGNNDHEYFSLLHNASMARYSSSRVIICEVYIRTRRCASRAHRCIQPIETDLWKHIRFLLLFQNLRSSVTMIVSIPFDSSYCLHSSKLLIFFFFFF